VPLGWRDDLTQSQAGHHEFRVETEADSPEKSGKCRVSTGEFRSGGHGVFVDGFDDLCSGTKWANMMMVVEVQAVSVLVRSSSIRRALNDRNSDCRST